MHNEKKKFIIEHHAFIGCTLYLILSLVVHLLINDILHATCIVDFMFYGWILYRRKKHPIVRDAVSRKALYFIIGTAILLLLTTYFWSCWYMSNMSDSLTSAYTDVLGNVNVHTYMFTISLAAPFGEEALFRYIVVNGFMHGLKRFSKPIQYSLSIILSALIFALMHGTGVHLLIGFFSGMALALLYLSTNDLRYSIIAHMCYNIGTIFITIPNSLTLSVLLTLISAIFVIHSIKLIINQ